MNVLSLFDGMSCGQIALNRLGIHYDNYFASEVDPYAISVTQFNYPKTIQLGDVTKVSSKDLPKIDLLIGGSPCQGFSLIGNGLNFEDPRSKLFFEYIRLLKECKPKYFLLENVKMKREHEYAITELLGVSCARINSRLVSAQNRPRLYWTNIPGDGYYVIGNYINQPKDKGILLKDILMESDDYIWRPNKIFTFNADTPADPNGKASCLRAAAYGSVYNETKNKYRYYIPEECEALQTVPIGYTKTIGLDHYNFSIQQKMNAEGKITSEISNKNNSMFYIKDIDIGEKPKYGSMDISIQKFKAKNLWQYQELSFFDGLKIHYKPDVFDSFILQNSKGSLWLVSTINDTILLGSFNLYVLLVLLKKLKILSYAKFDLFLQFEFYHLESLGDGLWEVFISSIEIIRDIQCSATQRRKMLGNGWTIDVITHILKGMEL